MTQYTSLETSKRLYEAFGWETDTWYMTDPDGKMIGRATPRIFKTDREYKAGYRTDTPVYDSDYLLENLQKVVTADERYVGIVVTESDFVAQLTLCDDEGIEKEIKNLHADTPSEALGLLALKLREEGVL